MAKPSGATARETKPLPSGRWPRGSERQGERFAFGFRPSALRSFDSTGFRLPVGQYGEMRPILVDGKRGAVVFVRPETEGLGPDIARLAREDSLFRDTVVYLTCLHEIGHSLGLRHTASYDDIMYFFGHGGDIPNYFSRYYRELTTRDDIQRYSGLSPDDVRRLRELYRH